ncbi:MAG: hypothetical protein HC831_28820, partial [Chloroflexia bacterium]|nr:hypothetical protein [Chloroflexia bacterium]
AYSVPNISGATGYSWALPSGAVIVEGENTRNITVDFLSNAISGDIVVRGINSCGTSHLSSKLRVNMDLLPNNALSISGYDKIRAGETGVTYSTAPITNATGYIWSLPPGASIVAGENTRTITVNFSEDAVSGDISVFGSNPAGNGEAYSKRISVCNSAPPPPVFIAGDSRICNGSSTILKILPIDGANYYWWTSDFGLSSTGGSTEWTATRYGTYSVQVGTACGVSVSSRYIGVDYPLTDIGEIEGPNTVCEGQSATFKINPVHAASGYLWESSTGSSNFKTTPEFTLDNITSTTEITVKAQNKCGFSTASSKTVYAATANPSMSFNNQKNIFRKGEMVSITVSGGNGGTEYYWSYPIFGNRTTYNNVLNFIPLESGTLYVYTDKDCVGATLEITIDDVAALNVNYTKTTTPKLGSTSLPSKENCLINYKFDDGLGRTMQNLAVGASPSGKDVIQIFDYEDDGKEWTRYMPFSIDNDGHGLETSKAIEKYNEFYENLFHEEVIYTAPIKYEKSPLGRILNIGSPGKDWQINGGSSVANSYSNNQYAEDRWTAVGNGLDESMIQRDGSYPARSIFITTTIDEDGKQTKIYKNTQGQIIKKVKGTKSTKYVYDDLGLLRCIIPPRAVGLIIDDLCYFYIYDKRQRLIGKRLPGAEPIYMAYDERDRLVLVQDGNLREKKQWIVNQYDEFNQPTLTGIYTDNEVVTRNRDEIEEDYIEDPLSIVESADFEEISRTYYNSYPSGIISDYPPLNLYNIEIESGLNYNDKIKGEVTYTETKIQGKEEWLTTVYYYDDEYKVIQVSADNRLNGKDIVHNKFDFLGKLEESKHEHSTKYGSHTISKRYLYDHAGRITNMEMNVDDKGWKQTENYIYNEQGQIITKNIHKNGANYLLDINLAYNIRGWIKNISSTDKDGKSLFDLELMYNKNSVNNSNRLYNGNISAIQWSSSLFGNLKSFDYSYDDLDRLINATYSGIDDEDYATSYSYDLNGNINSLTRQGMFADKSFGEIDQLTYIYNKNQLIGVNDNATDSRAKLTGFTEIGQQLPVDFSDPTTHEYRYDANGNMTEDHNKGIQLIDYNYQNLPTKIDLGSNNWLEYLYNIDGTKLQQTVFDDGSIYKT